MIENTCVGFARIVLEAMRQLIKQLVLRGAFEVANFFERFCQRILLHTKEPHMPTNHANEPC